jgi:hypothetical protein
VLDLSSNGVSEAGYLALGEALRSNASLTHLVLNRNSKPSAAVFQSFVDAVAVHPALVKLTLPSIPKVRSPSRSCALCVCVTLRACGVCHARDTATPVWHFS